MKIGGYFMFRSIRVFSLFACFAALAALAAFASHFAKADDATSQPSAATGSIVVTVVDSDGKPAPKVRLNLYVQADPNATTQPSGKPKAIAKGRSDEDGKFTFESVAFGDYRVSGSLKSNSTKGSVKTSVTSDAPNPEVTITMSAPADDSGGSGGGATTAPSTPPAQ
jgi:5-hydroxyisourate hydrolase-like protein (transthyretin family)